MSARPVSGLFEDVEGKQTKERKKSGSGNWGKELLQMMGIKRDAKDDGYVAAGREGDGKALGGEGERLESIAVDVLDLVVHSSEGNFGDALLGHEGKNVPLQITDEQQQDQKRSNTTQTTPIQE